MRSLALRSQFATLELRSNRRSEYSLCSLPCLYISRMPHPEPEGRDSGMGRPPVEMIYAVAEQPSQPVTRRNATADAETPHIPTGTPTHEEPGTPHGHGHRTSHGIQTSTPSSNEADSSRPARPHLHQTPQHPRHATPRGKPHRRIPTGGLRKHRPPRLALGAKTRPRSL